MEQQTKERLAAAGIQADEMIGRVMGSEKLALRFWKMFLADPAPLDALRQAVAAGDWAAAQKAAHGLKGSSGNVSFTALYALFDRQNRLLREGSHAEAAALMPEIEAAWARAAAAIGALEAP